MTFREIARRMVERAREEIRADLAAQRYPEHAVPVPMVDHLASLPALPPPPDDDGDDDDPEPDDLRERGLL